MVRHSIITALLVAGVAVCATSAFAQDEQETGVGLTVYNKGFAMVKEKRKLSLPKRGMVKFPNVAATIIPETVTFSAISPTGATVLEQNYEFDLVSANKLLSSYIDRKIGVVDRAGNVIEGTLLSSDSRQLVLSGKDGIELIPRAGNVRDVRFSKLPDGLLTKPTLVWKVKAEEPGEHLVRVAYRANGMRWNVNYRAVANAAADKLNLSGWVTVTNNCGTTFSDAQLKLMAGDVNTQETDKLNSWYASPQRGRVLSKRKAAFEEKSFSEYHLYTLSEPTTLKNAQTKQIELINISEIPVTKSYVYRPEFGTKVGVVMNFKNSKETRKGLGIPLPKGPFRVYQTDATDQQSEFVGSDSIDHTPKDEVISIRQGYAFDLTGSRTRTDFKRWANEKREVQQWTVRVRNHKNEAVKVKLIEPLQGGRNWEFVTVDQDWKKKDFRTVEVELNVPADGQAEFNYTVEYTW